MSARPLVSVVIIFLNAERFIREAIESVVGQTYAGWELLLVDDGSADASGSIALEFADRFPERIRYLTHPDRENRGMSASRNLGIRHATGDFVALLDADDVWLTEKLERQVAILAANPRAAMVYGPTQWWFGWTGQPADDARDFIHDLGVPPDRLIEPPTLLTALLRDEGVSPCTCSILIRRDVLEAVGGFEERFRGLYEDQALCAKVCLRWPVFAASECWYRYRQHPDSACAVAERAGTRQASRQVYLDWLAAWLDDQDTVPPAVLAALARERRRAARLSLRESGVRAMGPAVRAAGERARSWWRGIQRVD
jgi:glycosyltransferase involved in cell wall biosynthesis